MAIAGAMAAAVRVFDPNPAAILALDAAGVRTGGRQWHKRDGIIVPRFEMLRGASSVGHAGFGRTLVNGASRAFAPDAPLIGDGGLRVPEVRTNSIRNPVMAGSSGGKSGGTINGAVPNNMVVTAVSGVTVNLSKATINGSTFLVAEVSGTPSASPHFNVFFEDPGAVTASNGQTWTEHMELALLSGVMPFTTIRLTMLNSMGSPVGSELLSPDIGPAVGATAEEFRFSATTNDAGVASLRPRIVCSGSGSAVGYTVAIGLPNLKFGPDINDPAILQTSGLPATRPAVAQSLRGVVIPPMHSGAVRFRWLGTDVGAFPVALGLDDDTANSRILAYRTNASGACTVLFRSGADQITIAPSGVAALDVDHVLAWRAEPGNYAACLNGGPVATSSSPIVLPTFTHLRAGHVRTNSTINVGNGIFATSEIYDAPLPNNRLQSLCEELAA